MLRLADILNITKPCQKLYDAFITNINSSKDWHSLHGRCIKLIDALVGTHTKDENRTLFSEYPLPTESMTLKFSQHHMYSIAESINLNYIIVKANIEVKYLNLMIQPFGI